MANSIASYNPIWYAQKALEQLEKRLNFVRTMSRRFDEEGKPREPGDTIEVRVPGTFVAQAMPAGSTEDIKTGKIQTKVDQWWGVQFGLRDDELTFSGERIITEHIDPAMQALAEKIENWAVGLYVGIPWAVTADGSVPTNDFISARKQLNINGVLEDGRQAAISPTLEETYLKLALFHQANTSSDGGETQRKGRLGEKFGFDSYANFSLPTHTKGTLSATDPLLKGETLKGAESLILDKGTLTGTLKKGDSFVLAGNTQRYVVTADATAASNEIAVSISPALVADYVDDSQATVRLESREQSLFYRPEAFVMATAILSDKGNGKGAEVGSAIDDQTGMSIRVMRWYDPNAKKHFMSFDALWGGRVYQPNAAIRVER